MATSSDHAADYVDGAPQIGAVRHIAVHSALGRRGCETVDSRSDYPFVAKIIEMRVKTADIDAGTVTQLVVNSAAEAVTRPIVRVQTYILGIICSEVGRVRARAQAIATIALNGLRCRLDVVDAAAV